MSQPEIQQLLRVVRTSIAQIESSGVALDDRVLRRILAYLWTAHDELELVAPSRPR